MSFSLFEIGKVNNADAIIMSENKIASYLSRDLGIESAKARNNSILATMGDPEKQLDDYNTALDTLLDKAATVYKHAFDKLTSLGLPAEKAQQVAKNKAAIFIQHEKTILDLEFPLANDINVLASIKAKSSINIRRK